MHVDLFVVVPSLNTFNTIIWIVAQSGVIINRERYLKLLFASDLYNFLEHCFVYLRVVRVALITIHRDPNLDDRVE